MQKFPPSAEEMQKRYSNPFFIGMLHLPLDYRELAGEAEKTVMG